MVDLPDSKDILSARHDPIWFLAALGLFDEATALTEISKKLKVEFADLSLEKWKTSLGSENFKKALDPNLLWKNKVIPLCEDELSVTVAFTNPLNIDTKKTLEFILSKNIKTVLAKESQILTLLAKHFPGKDKLFEEMLDTPEPQEFISTSEQDQNVEADDAALAPVIKLVNKIMSDAITLKASDIHIEPMQHELIVRYRIDGKMQESLRAPKKLQPYVTSRIKLMAGMDISERRRPQDGRCRLNLGGDLCDVRVSSMPTAHGETIVLRILKSTAESFNFDYLGISSDIQRRLHRALRTNGKMLLVTGPTGSGKTTTLYTCLHYLQDGSSNIVTVENPIEYRIPGINQIQTNESIDVTFPVALRSILRQDPDVIMVGEIRDGETANIAVEAALTGHKVLSTLHTNDAPAAISRLVHLGVADHAVAGALAGVLAQRLIRKVCSRCVEPVDPIKDQDQIERAKPFGISSADLKVGRGCPDCNSTGYSGRAGIYSYLEVDEVISGLIANKSSSQDIAASAAKRGFLSIHHSALGLLKAGVTSFDEVEPYLELSGGASTAPSHELIQKSDVTIGATKRIKKPKVLLIEDDADVRSVLAMLLTKEFFEVTEASQGKEGLERFYEDVPDLILCDLMMPVMDGREFIHKLRAIPAARDIPIVILTAADTEENETGLLDLGAKDFVSKTSSSTVMLSRIRRALSR